MQSTHQTKPQQGWMLLTKYPPKFRHFEGVILIHHEEAYKVIKEIYDDGDESSEVLWRLMRAILEVVARLDYSKKEKKRLLLTAKIYAVKAYEQDPKHFESVKYAALVSGQLREYLGIRAAYEENKLYLKLLNEALFLREEVTLWHLSGRWFFDAAMMSTKKRLALRLLLKKPPRLGVWASIPMFTSAYRMNPKFVENTAYLGLALFYNNEKGEANQYLREALHIPLWVLDRVNLQAEVRAAYRRT